MEFLNLAPKDLWPNADMFHSSRRIKSGMGIAAAVGASRNSSRATKPLMVRTGTYGRSGQITSGAGGLESGLTSGFATPPEPSMMSITGMSSLPAGAIIENPDVF